MRAQYLQNGTIAVSGTVRAETFNRIWAGVGWPDLDPGYVCVVGERTDGRYHALWEQRGGLWEIGDALLQAKDRFLIDCILVDARDELATSYLRTREGLCFYEESVRHTGDVSTPVLPRPRVAHADKPVATVVPVPERITANYRSALEKTRGIIMAGNVLVHEANCPRLVYTLRQPVEDLLKSPIMKALVWVVTAMEDSRGNDLLEDRPRDVWYQNPLKSWT